MNKDVTSLKRTIVSEFRGYAPTARFFGLWAISVYAIAVLARAIIPDHIQGAHVAVVQTVFPLVNFDSGYYFSIATHGYNGSVLAARAFFPLFPLLLKFCALLLAFVPSVWRLPLASTILNCLLTLIALWLSGKLLRKDFRAPAVIAVFILLYPYGFALISGYAEATLLCLTIGAFLAARSGKWWLAGILAGLAGASRLPGLILAPVLLVEYMHQSEWKLSRVKTSIAWLALAPLGAVLYAAYLEWFAGGFKSYFKAYLVGWPERKLNLNVLSPIIHVFSRAISSHGAAIGNRVSYNDLISLMLIIFAVSLLVLYWRVLRPSYRVYCVLTILLPLTSSVLYGVGRYYLMLFPLYWLLGADLWENPYRLIKYVVPAVLLSALLVTLFSSTYFVG